MFESFTKDQRRTLLGAFSVAIWMTVSVLLSTAQTTSVETSQWRHEERTDPLRGTAFSQFSLAGKFLTAPRNSPDAQPLMVVRCTRGKDHHGHTNGKFVSGYIFVGGVVDSNVNGSGEGAVSVEFRLDDGKLQSETWGRSTDFSAIFFRGYDVFANLLYGHHMYHNENTNPQVRKVVIGVPEFLGGEVVMQFDMPDATEVADACGIIWHK